ncbi:MAG: class I SAM-dependent methyltransferase [Nocardioides sp.]|nr:class I SAM-dependent methyltransferase [Nocardioides sp.]
MSSGSSPWLACSVPLLPWRCRRDLRFANIANFLAVGDSAAFPSGYGQGRLAHTSEHELDPGAGHGGDSLWLAANGWTVTAVDVSATALGRMADAVDEAGLTQRVSMQQHDLTVTFPEGQFDLVTATYFQSPVAMDRPAVLRRSADAITPGGLLVVIDHASAPSWSTHGAASFPTAAQTLDEIGLDSRVWHTELCVTRDREATGHNGKTGTLADNVLVLRKDR